MNNQETNRRVAQGKRLKAARVAWADLSLRAMATEVSKHWTRYNGDPISSDFVRRIEAGDRDAEIGYVHAVAEVTGQPLAWLLGVDLTRDDVRANPGQINRRTRHPIAAGRSHLVAA